MTPLWLSSLQPFAELTAILWLMWRVDPRKYPALMTYLLTEACWHIIATWPGYTWLLRYGHAERMLCRAWLVGEVFQYARVDIDRRSWTAILAACCSICMIASGWLFDSQLPAFYSLMLFRQWFQLILAGALWALCLGCWPRIERRTVERLAHRWGVAAWMSILAVSGTFVHGGIAYRIAADTDWVYDLASLLTYATLTVTVAVMALGMGWEGRTPRAQASLLDRRRKRALVVVGRAA